VSVMVALFDAVTHLFIVGGSAVPATVLLMGSLAIAWARRGQLASAWSTRRHTDASGY
jgi:hypothetical protein